MSHPERRDGNLLLGKSCGGMCVSADRGRGAFHTHRSEARGGGLLGVFGSLSLQALVSPSKGQVHWANAFLESGWGEHAEIRG